MSRPIAPLSVVEVISLSLHCGVNTVYQSHFSVSVFVLIREGYCSRFFLFGFAEQFQRPDMPMQGRSDCGAPLWECRRGVHGRRVSTQPTPAPRPAGTIVVLFPNCVYDRDYDGNSIECYEQATVMIFIYVAVWQVILLSSGCFLVCFARTYMCVVTCTCNPASSSSGCFLTCVLQQFSGGR